VAAGAEDEAAAAAADEEAATTGADAVAEAETAGPETDPD